MSGEAYTRRYPGPPAGFFDLPLQVTPIDSQFLNAVEAALLRLLGADPTDGAVQTWDAALARFKTILLTNAQISGGAGISRAKLDFGAGLVDADIAPGAAIASSKISGLSGTAPPPGGMMLYGGSVAPSGWLICDGSAVSRTTQAGLYAILGTAYGVGDGSTTFNLPDFRGRVPVGLGTHADVNALGDSDGVGTVANRRPKHSHAATGLTATFTGTAGNTGNDTPDHQHGLPNAPIGGTGDFYVTYAASGVPAVRGVMSAGASAQHHHPFTPAGTIAMGGSLGAAGMTDGAGWMTVNVIIKT